jgi:hypothetical protein
MYVTNSVGRREEMSTKDKPAEYKPPTAAERKRGCLHTSVKISTPRPKACGKKHPGLYKPPKAK